ncbi:ATP-dependent helicase [Glycocaulis profundi]|nr:ATP-dependent helicase [Glycocaulis profundi]
MTESSGPRPPACGSGHEAGRAVALADPDGSDPDTAGARRVCYGRLERVEGGFVLDGAPAHVKIKLKAIFPHIDKASTGPFRFDAGPEICADLLWFRQRYPFDCSLSVESELIAGRDSVARVRAELGRVFAPDWTPPDFAGLQPGQAVRPFQAQAVEILNRFDGLLIADKVGAGKTYTTLAAALTEGNLPLIVVAPPHLSGQWVTVTERFTTLRAHEIGVTTPYDLPEADVYVFRYSNVAGWVDVLTEMDVGLVCFDEVSELRHGRSTVKGRACWELAERARRKIGLDATPMYNWGVEMWTIMSYLRPEVLGGREDFLREWAPDGHVDDPRALGDFLADRFALVRRSGEDVRIDVSVVHVDHDMEALDSIADVAVALAETARSGAFHERGQAVRELDLRVRHATGVAKAPFVARFIDMLIETRGPVLVAGWHRDVYDIWRAHLSHRRCRLYTGTETPKRKAEAAAAFIAGEVDAMFMSLRSGKGLDGLQAASNTAVIGELDWSPATHKQFIGRLGREGQIADHVAAFFPVATDGSDPPMMEVNGLKSAEQSAILDPGLGAHAVAVDDGSRVQALVDSYLNRPSNVIAMTRPEGPGGVS